MGKSSGCVLFFAGIAVAAYALYPRSQGGTEIASAQVARDAAGDRGADRAARAAKPASGPDARSEPSATQVVPLTHLVPPSPVPARRPRTGAAVRIDKAPPRVPVGERESAAAAPLDGAALTREIQRELKRVGCYQGYVTGVWTPSVRQAMRVFTERANASLPVERPDPVLLAMVQSHAPGVCSAACPSGQDRAADGRCVPSALVTSAGINGGAKAADRAGKQRAAAVAGSAPAAPPTASDRPADGRMSLAGPATGAAQQTKAAPRRQAGPPRSARASRSAHARSRARRAAQRRPSSGYSGLPSWAFPLFMQ
jgi:hypothetical protein